MQRLYQARSAPQTAYSGRCAPAAMKPCTAMTHGRRAAAPNETISAAPQRAAATGDGDGPNTVVVRPKALSSPHFRVGSDLAHSDCRRLRNLRWTTRRTAGERF